MRLAIITLFTLAATLGSTALAAPADPDANRPAATQLTVERTVEDGVDLLLVTVTDSDGKPLEGVTVGAYIKRQFGELVIGRETTFDDGTAYIALPKDLPPAKSGRLSILVRVIEPQDRAGSQAQIEVTGAPVAGADEPPLPYRALWASHAPFSLIATLAVLLGGVWSTYGFVFYQVRCLRKGI
jgi:hypothetical protein